MFTVKASGGASKEIRNVAQPQSFAGSSVISRTASYQPSLFASENPFGWTSFTKRDQGSDRQLGEALGAWRPWRSMTHGLAPVTGQGPDAAALVGGAARTADTADGREAVRAAARTTTTRGVRRDRSIWGRLDDSSPSAVFRAGCGLAGTNGDRACLNDRAPRAGSTDGHPTRRRSWRHVRRSVSGRSSSRLRRS